MPFVMVRQKNSPTSSPIFMLDFINVLNRTANKIILKETPRVSQSLLWLAVHFGESAAAGQSCMLQLSCFYGSLISVSSWLTRHKKLSFLHQKKCLQSHLCLHQLPSKMLWPPFLHATFFVHEAKLLLCLSFLLALKKVVQNFPDFLLQ